MPWVKCMVEIVLKAPHGCKERQCWSRCFSLAPVQQGLLQTLAYDMPPSQMYKRTYSRYWRIGKGVAMSLHSSVLQDSSIWKLPQRLVIPKSASEACLGKAAALHGNVCANTAVKLGKTMKSQTQQWALESMYMKSWLRLISSFARKIRRGMWNAKGQGLKKKKKRKCLGQKKWEMILIFITETMALF